jgi:FlaA1/EpsC-like NDP-sugar epimerase
MQRELRDTNFDVVGFLDDDEELQRRRIGGCRVLGVMDDLETVVREHRVDEVILCMPSAPKTELQRLTARCQALSVKTSSVPTLAEIISGQMSRQPRPVSMEALLGRHSISHPDDITELARTYGGRRILVTGAGGSIGSELVRQLRRFQPSQLILLDKDENNLYEITCEIREDFDAVVEVIADIRNLEVMEKLFETHRPEVVFHAAAYKHVPLMEHYPAEAILNNVMGTRHVAELSNAYGVKVFVLISTDKAVNPSNTMGASKRVAEMIVQSLASRRSGTRFCCVRFGNVLGSRASVVPIFQRQIRQGKNITVTHPDVTRYFMTIPEAVQLVIQAGSLGSKGEIFLLDMGSPVKIVDLARNLIELSGLVPDEDISIEFTGLRPGEKLDEELLIAGERSARSTKHSKIFVVGALNHDWSRMQPTVGELERAAHSGDTETIHQILRSLNIGYQNKHHPDLARTAPVPFGVRRERGSDRPSTDFAPAGNA